MEIKSIYQFSVCGKLQCFIPKNIKVVKLVKRRRSKMETKEAEAKKVLKGAFVESLKRNNRKIREDRATAISEDTSLVYKRRVEDLEIAIKRMKRTQENMYDLSPADAHSLTPAKDFDCDKFVEEDIALGIKIRETEIKLDIARKQFTYLFGGY